MTPAERLANARPWGKDDYAIAYVRVSSDIQTTVPEQVRMAQDQARELGLPIPSDGIYIDQGESRSLFYKRVGLQDALKRQEDPHCRVMIMWIFSRVIGSPEQVLEVYGALSHFKTRLFDAKGNEEDLTSHAAKLTALIKGWQSEGEVIELRQRVRDTHMMKAEQGRLISRPPYGIDVVPVLDLPCRGTCSDGGKGCPVPHAEVSKKNSTVWTMNETEVAHLRMIYQWVADGITLHEVSLRLERMGIRGPVRTVKSGKNEGRQYGGEAWSKSNLRRMLLNPFYRGEIIWNQYRTERYKEDKKRVQNDPSEWVRQPHMLGPLVDIDLFDRAEAQITRRRKTRDESRKYPVKLWDGFVQCGRCGWRLYPRRRSQLRVDGTRSDLYDYSCNGVYNDYSTCTTHHSVPENALNDLLRVDNQVSISRLTPMFEVEEEDVVTPQLKVIEQRMVELKAQLESLKQLALANFFTPTEAVAERLKLEKEQNEVIAQRNDLLDTPEGVEPTPHAPVELAELAKNLLDESIPIESRRAELNRLVDRVVIDKPRARVVLRVQSPKTDD